MKEMAQPNTVNVEQGECIVLVFYDSPCPLEILRILTNNPKSG